MKNYKNLFLSLSVLMCALFASTIALFCINANQSRKINNLKKQNQTLKINAAKNAEVHDFYVTLGTVPTLYAVLNAYENQNPNTYMWFQRGNTISYEYSADFIHYFSTQSTTNQDSTLDLTEVKTKIASIKENNPGAKFHLYCDDIRVRYILELFVVNGVPFDQLEVTLLSDGTKTYQNYNSLSGETYAAMASEWQQYLNSYAEHIGDYEYSAFGAHAINSTIKEDFAFYVSTFSNVNYWIQSPEYLVNSADQVSAARYNMNIVKKDPKAMYNAMNSATRSEFQKVVLANALVGSDTLLTLEDAQNYFDSKLANRDKDVVLILGNKDNELSEANQSFLGQTIDFYTPTKINDGQVKFKGKTYDVDATGANVELDGKQYVLGECSVYLFFKGHPSYPANAELMQYFAEKNIEVLPHRTPVETLFWMYDVKVGGYESSSFLSTSKGQTEFIYGEFALSSASLKQMQDAGFFDDAVFFNA